MKSKYLINVLFSILMLASMANAAQFYDSFEFSFGFGVPSDMIIQSYECQDSSCSIATPANIEVFSGDALTCWDTYGQAGDSAGFDSCINNYRINGPVNLNSDNRVFIKYDTVAPFGYVTYLFTSGDEYFAKRIKYDSFNCEYDICVYDSFDQVSFSKALNAIAEVGQINIKNIDNPLFPVQIEVPVVIEETVCSAFQYTNPSIYRPIVPAGYSDYSANTLVSLEITNNNDGTQYLSQAITIPIEADTCAGLAAFSWTPNSGLLNQDIKFRVETLVTDNQVLSSTMDWAQVIERVYPSDLDGACWTRSYDFTLSNVPTTDMTTSTSVINVGESLYAVFEAGGFRDSTITPMNFEAIVLFNGTVVSNQLFNTPVAVTEDDLNTYIVDLTNRISGLSAGQYNVTLITRPVGTNCAITSSVTQTQNLEIVNVQTFDVRFHVRDPNFNLLQGASVNFELFDAADYFVVDPVYDMTLITNNNGIATFTGAVSGNYTYLISANAFTSVSNDIFVGGDMDIYVTLPATNVAPVIDLPNQITSYYLDVAQLNILNYVRDFNDPVSSLTYSYRVVSGNTNILFNNPMFSFTTTNPNVAVIEITVTDPSGAQATDSMIINFIDNNEPVINSFYANPDNGATPFNAPFFISVSDDDGDSLTCIIEFGDGLSTTINNCENVAYIEHLYPVMGTYNIVLRVTDGMFNATAQEQIFVFERAQESPVINYFRLTSSNGLVVPTDLYFTWDVTHSANYPMSCTFRVNGVNSAVPCIGSSDILGFNLTGISRFHIIAIDNNGVQVIRTITQEFLPNTIRLNDVTTHLIVNDKIVPGEFNFVIETTNETLARRDIFIRPIIECRGIENRLDNVDGMLKTSVVSRNDDGITMFRFTTDTRDFELKVPTDENCEFKVILTDGYGSNLELSDNVEFGYIVEETPVASIRGKSVDVLNYMSSSITSFDKGYNTIEFIVTNNLDIEKELVITMTSSELGVNYNEEVNLAAGQERTVQIPVYIGKDIEQGRYPIRFGVRESEDKQVRYSYIIVN